jgi:hypothetical protein
MPFYNYLFLLTVLSIIILSIILLIHLFNLRKKNIPVGLFVEALRNENNGHFEEAVINYETALNEAKKIRFNNTLKGKITGKLKLLHTIIEYNNNLHFIR